MSLLPLAAIAGAIVFGLAALGTRSANGSTEKAIHYTAVAAFTLTVAFLLIDLIFAGGRFIGGLTLGSTEQPTDGSLTWTGSLAFLNIPLFAVAAIFAALVVLQILLVFVPARSGEMQGDGTIRATGIHALVARLVTWSLYLILLILLAYLVLGALLGPDGGIIGAVSQRFTPVWIALVVLYAVSIRYKRKLGLYGKLFDSTIGMIGFGLVMFWVFTAIFSGVFDLIYTHDPLAQVSGMKNKLPGTPLASGEEGAYGWYLLGGDNLARDVFSRMVLGSGIVMLIAPLATLFAFMVGITLGLPAAFYGGRLDTFLSFLANLILAFPVILLFYLLVTPEIVASGLPNMMAMILFVFPLVFFFVLLNSRLYTQPAKRNLWVAIVLIPMVLVYLMMISQEGTVLHFVPAAIDLFDIPGGILVVFVSVVFVNAPTVFRIVRGLGMDIKTRDYVAAAQTRGEGPWYIMLWEVLPNARGPLIVDFCLRIGYTTILLGTLGFFGLGLPPESPDWGSTINDGRKLLSIYPHPALPPAFALLSLVLGLNLLADGLREESLKD